ncbi:MAG: 2-phospho-L-lactate guanylyltransferase [Ardenticatenales bacterium]|nr:2-phospho-L-lactate guanylyltransferase [Ardenticatenales bacterium]
MSTWCILPVRSLAGSKSRLAGQLDAAERAALTSRFVRRTIAVLQAVPAIERILVVSRDPAVFALVASAGVVALSEGEPAGLNSAVGQAVAFLTARGAAQALILPADLPFVSSADVEALLAAAGPGRLVIAPDERGDGTNALLLSLPARLPFQYGEGSQASHLAAAAALGLATRQVQRPGLAFDLDTEADWRSYQRQLADPSG